MGMLQVWVHDNRGGYQDMWAGQVRGVKGRGGGRGGLGGVERRCLFPGSGRAHPLSAGRSTVVLLEGVGPTSPQTFLISLLIKLSSHLSSLLHPPVHP